MKVNKMFRVYAIYRVGWVTKSTESLGVTSDPKRMMDGYTPEAGFLGFEVEDLRTVQSTEIERDHEQHQENKRRLSAYYAKQRRVKPLEIDWSDVPYKHMPESWWLKVEAD